MWNNDQKDLHLLIRPECFFKPANIFNKSNDPRLNISGLKHPLFCQNHNKKTRLPKVVALDVEVAHAEDEAELIAFTFLVHGMMTRCFGRKMQGGGAHGVKVLTS